MTFPEAQAEARRRWGPMGFATSPDPETGRVSVGYETPHPTGGMAWVERGVSLVSYKDAFKNADLRRAPRAVGA